jgi:hypothetical protein
MILLLLPVFSLSMRPVGARTRKIKADKTAGVAPVADKAQAEQPAEPITDFVVAAPYWSLEDGFTSTIELRNNRVDGPLTVTPVLYPLHGQKMMLKPLTLNPSESRLLNISEAIGKKLKGVTTGAVEILYRHTTHGALGASLTVLNEARSLIYNFSFQRPEQTSRLEGLWWFLDQNTDGFTAMQNASGSEIRVTPTLYVKERAYRLNAVRLRPHETEVIHLRQELRKLGLDKSTEGGIQLASTSLGALVAGGGLVNPQRGFSAPLRMNDPQMLAMHVERLGRTLHAISVPIGKDMPDMGMGLPDGSLMNPIMTLRNVSDKTISVQPVFKYEVGGGGSNSFTLPEVQLKPQQTKRIELLPFWKSGLIPEMVSWGSLEINYTGKAGSLIASVSSVDQTGTYVFDAKIDNRLAAGFVGDYWSVQGDNDTAITVKNITNAPATCWLNLQYDRGRKSYQMQPLVLQAGEARMIDLKHVRMERMPGINGELFPETATFGGLELIEEAGGRHFLIDTVVYNPKNATCGPCGTGCIYVSWIEAVNRNMYLVSGSSDTFIVRARLCTGTYQDWSSQISYTEDNSSATQITTGSPIYVLGMNGGINHLNIYVVAPGPFCDDKVFSTSESIVVKPKINSITPARGLIGTAVPVTISGQGFGITPTVNAGTGISANVNIAQSSFYQVVATFTIAATAPTGDNAVTVTVGGQTSNSVNFYVQVPTSLSVLGSSVLPTGTTPDYGCQPGADGGIKISVRYQVLDQGGQPIRSNQMEPQEKLLNYVLNGGSSSNPFPNWRDVGPSPAVTGTSQYTDANGQFLDAPYGACATSGYLPLTVTYDQPMSILVVGGSTNYAVRNNHATITSSAMGTGQITVTSDDGGNIQLHKP